MTTAGSQQAASAQPGAGNEAGATQASVTEKVSEAIIRGIRQGTFVPGQHLVEPDLTRRLGISRGSLREAFKHLAADGIVTLTRFRGAYISNLDLQSVLDLLETLEPLAKLAARRAVINCTTQPLQAQIRSVAKQVEDAGRSGARALYLDRRRAFYDAMVELAGNRELARIMPLSRTDLFRVQLAAVQSSEQRLRHLLGYSQIAEAIAAQAPAAAEAAIARHFEGTRITLSELPQATFTEAV